MTDEEKKEYEELKSLLYTGTLSQHGKRKLIDMFEKQSKEIEEAEQKERKAYIKGTNDADELCNKKWKDKIKAEIEEIDFMIKKINQGHLQKYTIGELLCVKRFLQSLLEKE